MTLTTSKPNLTAKYHYDVFDDADPNSNVIHGIQHYFGEFRSIEESNEVKVEEVDKSKFYRKRSDIVSIPLNISLNVVESDVNGTDRLVIGQNDGQIMVKGKNDQVLVSGYGECI